MPEISQEQLDQLTAKAKEADELSATKIKLEKDLEDTRMEVLTPEYTKWLESQEKGGDKDKGKGKDKTEEEDELKGLTPKQLLERAKKEALDEIRREKDEESKSAQSEASKKNAREIAKFAKDHDDFEQFRPVMYGLSKDPKNADMNLSDLYKAAKDHVGKIKTGTTEAEKERQRRTQSEKPSGDAASFEKLKKMSTSDINREALDEVKNALGPIPAA